MAAARYWRMVGIETYAGGDLELSALHLYSADARVDATATLTCSHAPIAGTLANLQDDNTATVCRFAGAAVRSAGFALVWDFGAGNAFDITAIRPGAGGDKAAFLASCLLQSSDDGLSWAYADFFDRYPWPGANSMCVMEWHNGDANFANVSALLQFDGPHGSTSIIDVKGNTFAVYGNAHIDEEQSKFGRSSAKFDGAGDYIKDSAASGIGAFGTSDFTIEFFVYLINGGHGSIWSRILETKNYPNSGGWAVTCRSNDNPAYIRFDHSNGAHIIESEFALPNNVFHHIAIARQGGSLRMFVNGLQQKSTVTNNENFFAPDFSSGSNINGGESFYGFVDEVRITKGVARYTANFTPPKISFANSADGIFSAYFDNPVTHTTRSRPAIAASAPVPAHSTASAPRLQMARDVEIGGQGTIYGTTKTAGAQGAPSTPTKARVVLLHQRSKLPVRETWSDPVTGNYAFTSIDTSQQFLVLAEDAQGAFRPVAANRLTPEVQP